MVVAPWVLSLIHIFYRPAELRRDLRDAQASELLHQAGYGNESCAHCVAPVSYTHLVGRGLVLQSAVLFALAVSFGGDAVWFTPIFSEFLCLVFSLRALKAYRRHPAGNRK